MCFKTPLWHFIISLVSERPVFKRIFRTSGIEGKMIKFLAILWLTATTWPRVASKCKYWSLAQDVPTQLMVILVTKVNKKVMFNLEQAIKAQRWGRGNRRWMGVGFQRHVSAASPPGKQTEYLFYKRLLRHQGQSGGVWKKIDPTRIRSLDSTDRATAAHNQVNKKLLFLWNPNLQKKKNPAFRCCQQRSSIWQEELQTKKRSNPQNAQLRPCTKSQDLQNPVQESISMFVSRKVINYTRILAATWRGFSYERLSS